MKEDADDLVVRIHQEAWERFRQQPPPPPKEPPTIHYSELPAAEPGSELAEEWNFYRREVGRLLAEGKEGKYILIKGQQILGIWDREEDALTTGYQKFLLQPFLVHEIQERERLLRVRYSQRWPS